MKRIRKSGKRSSKKKKKRGHPDLEYSRKSLELCQLLHLEHLLYLNKIIKMGHCSAKNMTIVVPMPKIKQEEDPTKLPRVYERD